MKKLMFVLSLVAVAVSAQAASLDWSVAPKSITSQTADPYYAFQKEVFLLDTKSAGYGDLIAALEGGTLEGGIAGFKASDWSGTVLGSAMTFSSSKTSKQSKSYGGISSAQVETDDESPVLYTLAALVFDKDSAGNDYYIVSGAANGQSYISIDDQSIALFNADSFAAGYTKYVQASPTPPDPGIPEPTSGLLLVLGGAVLALRRRRA